MTTVEPSEPPQPQPDPAAEPARPPRSRMPMLLAAAGVAIVGLVVALVLVTTSGDGDEPDDPAGPVTDGTFNLQGRITLSNTSSMNITTIDCAGSRGYDDIREGASVTVYDATSKIVGTGRLDTGVFYGDRLDGTCTFDFAVSGVPGDLDFYQVEVSRRGKVSFPADEVKGTLVKLTLG